MPRQRFTAHQVEATRSKLRDAALRAFEREGYAAATMRSIAREARCSAATPYVYFESKEALLTAIRAEGFRGLAACLEAAVEASRDPIEQLRGMLRGYIRFGLERPQVYRLMFSHRQGESAHLPVVRVPRERSFAVAHRLCRRMVDAGLATGDALAQAHLLWLNCHGLVSLHLANQLDLGADFESLVDPLVEHWARQFADRSSSARRLAARSHSRSRASKQRRKRNVKRGTS
jgi:AcrR family transcriptional regulator